MSKKTCRVCSSNTQFGYAILGQAPYTDLVMEGRVITAKGDNNAVYLAKFCPECGRDLRSEAKKNET